MPSPTRHLPLANTRTRFAPSPTGYLHVGGIRTALFAYLLARQQGGTFILRFEDTDKKREVAGSAEHLIRSLHAIGLNYDEGPDIGGPYAPYVQSQRLKTYQRWARELVAAGRAYADPYTPEQMQTFRNQAQAAKQPFLYRNHRPASPPEWDGSQPLRFKSEPRSYTWHDEVMGDITTGPEVIDDFVLMKSDGYPTYNFAHIVDDAEMHVTHVMRGQEFVSSMPNFLNLYDALGFDMTPCSRSPMVSEDSGFPPGARQEAPAIHQFAPSGSEETIGDRLLLPAFAHLPHIMNEQGNKKLGKRDGAKDVLDYIRDGYLGEAMMSFIATMGWNDGTEQEIFTETELIEKFSLARVQRSGARFDEKRLLWVNGQFIRGLSLDELYARASGNMGLTMSNEGESQHALMMREEDASPAIVSFWPASATGADEAYKKQVLALAQDRLKTLADLRDYGYFFAEPSENWSLITDNKQLSKLERSEIKQILQAVHDALETTEWTAESIQAALNQLLESLQLKPAILFGLVRVVTTWTPFSPELPATLALLGKQKTLERIRRAFV